MREMDAIHMDHPTMGTRMLLDQLRLRGYTINRKRVRRLARLMGIASIAPGPRTSKPGRGTKHKVFPYLLKGLEIIRPDQVWCADITYIPMTYGTMYLVAIMDWWSRYVLSWKLSNTMDVDFCVEALESALAQGKPGIFNTDQGSQFTSLTFTQKLITNGVAISMDGRGRYLDNIFIERLWRSLKQEAIYIREYRKVAELQEQLEQWFDFYNKHRPHSAHARRMTPAQAYKKHDAI